MASKPEDLLYGVDETPPTGRLLALGFQYAVLISVYLVVVILVARAAGVSPDVATDLISLALIAAAIGTVIQAWNGRFFGSGYLAPPVYSAIYFAPAILAAKAGGLPAVAGMTIFAGLVEIGLSRLLDRLRVVFQPLIAGFAVLVVGIQLGLVGVAETLDAAGETRPDFLSDLLVGMVTLAACIGFAIWGRGAFRLVSTLIGLALGIAVALATGILGPPTFATIAAADWFDLPDPSFLGYGFEPLLVPAFIASAIAATLRTVGVITTAQRINDADWKRPDMDNISRGVAGDGLGCLVAGLVNAPGMSTAASFVGLSSATAATSRSIGYAAAAMLVVFAFVPKVGAAIIGLPIGIAGAVLVFTAAFLVVSGIQVMLTHGLELRSGFAVSLALFVGIFSQVNPHYFALLPSWLRTVTSDMLTVSLVIAIALTLLFRIGIRRRDATTWSATDQAQADLDAFIRREAAAWKLDDAVAGRAQAAVDDLVERLKQGAYLGSPVEMDAEFDTLELTIRLVYRGTPPPFPTLGGTGFHAGQHEEASSALGIGHYFTASGADRTRVSVEDAEVTIRLGFAV